MTDKNREIAEQSRWRRKPEVPVDTIFDQLIDNEFQSHELRLKRESRALSQILRWCEQEIPFYRSAFQQAKVTAASVECAEDLPKLAVLSKEQVQRNLFELQAERLPRGEVEGGKTYSSGTSGRGRTAVVHTRSSRAAFAILKQREMRWFRFDPRKTLATIRLPSQLPSDKPQQVLAEGETVHSSGWPMLGHYFETGPWYGFSVLNPVDEQVAWLNEFQPEYLMSYAESLEHLAFAWGTSPAPPYLQGIHSISEQLTTGMRGKIGRVLESDIQENYGLNEVGLVATRCPEGGRFHVHSETCIVEIVDEAGQAVAPGSTGRLLVTVLSNPAMPLIRYDTGDLAQASAGDCICGRTLPAFSNLQGRYSRIAQLPEGTLGVVGVIREAIESQPERLLLPLRQFQIAQDSSDNFELRFVATAAMPDDVIRSINDAFTRSLNGRTSVLTIKYQEQIERAQGGKFQDFVSAFME